MSSKGPFPFRVSKLYFVHISRFSNACHIPRKTHPPYLITLILFGERYNFLYILDIIKTRIGYRQKFNNLFSTEESIKYEIQKWLLHVQRLVDFIIPNSTFLFEPKERGAGIAQ
jgi:hypothetical protein